MRKAFAILSGFICVVLVIIFFTLFYFTHKTHYLNIGFYQNSEYIDVVGEIHLKDYPNMKTIADKAAIKKIVNYLNNIQLTSVYGYFDNSRREFIIPEIAKNNKNLSIQDNEKYGCLIFYNEDRIETGRIIFHNEKYVEGLNYHAYKVQNEETFIISELEELNLK